MMVALMRPLATATFVATEASNLRLEDEYSEQTSTKKVSHKCPYPKILLYLIISLASPLSYRNLRMYEESLTVLVKKV